MALSAGSVRGVKSLRFANNVVWSASGQLTTAVLNFLLTPYLVARLGLEAYGLYILLHATANYLTLLAFGSGSAAVKYTAEFRAAGNGRGLREALRAASFMHLAGALIGALILCLASRFFVVRLFHVPEPMVGTGVFVLRCSAAGAVFAVLIQLLLAILQGLQRFDALNLVMLSQNGLMLLGTAGLLAAGLGIREVAMWYAVLAAGACLVAAGWTRRLLRPALGPAGGPGLPLRDFATWSLSSWLGPLAWLVTTQVDKVWIVHAESLASLTLYAVPAALLQRFQMLPAMVSAVVMPMMGELGPRDEESLRRMYIKSVRFLLWTGLPVLALLFAVMPQFLNLWLGAAFGGRSVWPARLLVVAQVFPLLYAMPNTATFSLNKPWYLPALAWSHALICVAAWRFLIPRYSLLGVALGTLAAQALPALVYLPLAHRRMVRIPFGQYLEQGLLAPGVSAAAMLAALLPFHDKVTTWLRLGLAGVLGALVFYGTTWLLMSLEDRDLVRQFLRQKSYPA